MCRVGFAVHGCRVCESRVTLTAVMCDTSVDPLALCLANCQLGNSFGRRQCRQTHFAAAKNYREASGSAPELGLVVVK